MLFLVSDSFILRHLQLNHPVIQEVFIPKRQQSDLVVRGQPVNERPRKWGTEKNTRKRWSQGYRFMMFSSVQLPFLMETRQLWFLNLQHFYELLPSESQDGLVTLGINNATVNAAFLHDGTCSVHLGSTQLNLLLVSCRYFSTANNTVSNIQTNSDQSVLCRGLHHL